jgi:threonine dehydrogenase-like Zn-dependent dehydrogenase
MTTNRRIVVSAVETMELLDEPVPTPADGEVRVLSTYIGVCGSDTHAFHGRHPFIPIPYLPGHEATGVVEELGAGRDDGRHR